MNSISDIRIMVVDDESFMLKLFQRLLSSQGEVVTCASAIEAIARIDTPEMVPDLIFLDLHMPEMDGVEFLRQLVARKYRGSMILISGDDERILQSVEKLVQAHDINMLGYLQKPFSSADLMKLMQKWSPSLPGRQPVEKKTYDGETLRGAIGGGELVNHYQPQIAVDTGEVVGMECLVRWQHPVDGLIFPDQFIGLAESHGLIGELTQVVLAGALADAKIWKEAGLALRIAVNVSMDNLADLSFPDIVHGKVLEANLSPKDLILEVTESRLMVDLKTPLDILSRLRIKNFHISIDDFGTGHSSMAQLRDIPFTELKVDRNFVHGASSNRKLRAIYDASLSLAKSLAMAVVAEGVEDMDDWGLLQSTGCDYCQGYLISKPMPGEDVLAWVDSWDGSELC